MVSETKVSERGEKKIVFFSTLYTQLIVVREYRTNSFNFYYFSRSRRKFVLLFFSLNVSRYHLTSIYSFCLSSFLSLPLDLQKWSSVINILGERRKKRENCITNRRSQTTLFYKDDTLIISAGGRNTWIKSFVFDWIASYPLWITSPIDFQTEEAQQEN